MVFLGGAKGRGGETKRHSSYSKHLQKYVKEGKREKGRKERYMNVSGSMPSITEIAIPIPCISSSFFLSSIFCLLSEKNKSLFDYTHFSDILI